MPEPTTALPRRWILLSDEIPDPRKRYLVTNNLEANDRWGQMSHVWISHIIESAEPEKYGRFVGFTDGDRQIDRLTHWMPIPEVDALQVAEQLLERAANRLADDTAPDADWWKDYYLFTGEHAVLTDEGWQGGEVKDSLIADEIEILDEVNAAEGGL